MKADTDSQKIKELLARSIEQIYPSKEKLKKALETGEKLKVYFGIDPTAPHLHLDHSTSLLILKRFQDLGHQVVLLIGDFTAQIGDPTGKISSRKQVSKEKVLKNCKNYKKQAGKILNLEGGENPAEIVFNSRWWGKMKLEEGMDLLRRMTLGRIIARDMFQKRMDQGKEIYLHELIYPLLQGYDSVALNVDVEIGGSDQMFNMLIGRDLMEDYRDKEKFVITKELLEDPRTGEILMSQSEGRFIALDESPSEMYGKIMALPDEVIPLCFEHWTEVPLKEVREIKNKLEQEKSNPRELKARLAREVITIYYDHKEALTAEKEFEKVFQKGKLPSEIPEIRIGSSLINILDLLVKANLASSKSQAKRLINQGGVRIDRRKCSDWQRTVKIKKEGTIIQVGKRKFIKALP